MNSTDPLLPSFVHDDDIVAVWHFGTGDLFLARTRREMREMDARDILRPSRGWHRVLRSFLCKGDIIFEPRAQYSAENIERFKIGGLNGI
jgi:hypothetical protein